MEVTRHFTATVFIVCDGRVLLHHHAKLDLLLPVGGHIERDELPEEAALREVREECGLEVTLWESSPLLGDAKRLRDARVLHQPVALLLEDINPHHQHIDFIYFASASCHDLDHRLVTENKLRWYSRDEIASAVMPDNVRQMAVRALDLLGGE